MEEFYDNRNPCQPGENPPPEPASAEQEAAGEQTPQTGREDAPQNLGAQEGPGVHSFVPQAGRCVRCGAVLLGGDVCPMCGLPASISNAAPRYQYIPAPPPKKSSTKKVVLIVLAVVLGAVLLFSGCMALLIGVARDADPSGSGAGEFDEYYDFLPHDFHLEYTNESRYLRVESLGTSRSDGTWDYPAPEGKEYVVVSLRITNLYEDIMAYDAADFELCNSNGNLTPSLETDLDTATALGYGRLLPDGFVEGTVVFLAPVGETDLVLYLNDYTNSICFPLL